MFVTASTLGKTCVLGTGLLLASAETVATGEAKENVNQNSNGWYRGNDHTFFCSEVLLLNLSLSAKLIKIF